MLSSQEESDYTSHRDGNPSNFWAGFGFRILKESVKKSDGFLRIPDSYFWRIPDSDSGF